MNKNGRFVDAADIAEYIGRSIDTVRYWERMGNVLPPSAKLGRRRVWQRADIEAWANSMFEAVA